MGQKEIQMNSNIFQDGHDIVMESTRPSYSMCCLHVYQIIMSAKNSFVTVEGIPYSFNTFWIHSFYNE